VRDLRSYVVKVYRQQAGSVAGTVQEVRTGRTVPFQTKQELWQAVRATTPISEAGPFGHRRATRPAAERPQSTEADTRGESDEKAS
jgi:hypothetical protein